MKRHVDIAIRPRHMLMLPFATLLYIYAITLPLLFDAALRYAMPASFAVIYDARYCR